ncbi:MAG: DUF4129 domain-containing protein [Verrucomicrobiota bacterium]
MRLDEVTAEIRPRSDWESVDLGFALVRRDFWRCLLLWWLALGPLMVVAGWWLWDSPVLFVMLVWWCKPAASRLVLFQLSRRLFGEQPGWAAIWRELPRVWWRRFFYRFGWARMSPWQPVTLAVEELEGLRGRAYSQRVAQVARRGGGAVVWTYLIAEVSAGWFGLALFALIAMLVPEGQDAPWTRALEEWDGSPLDVPLLLLHCIAGCVLVAMSLADVFLTGSGFGLYINTRTWIEGWDVELAFRRMAQRLAKVMTVVLVAGCCLVPAAGRAEPVAEPEPVAERTPHAVIEQIKAQPDFLVHKIKVPVAKGERPSGGWATGAFGGLLAWVFGVAALALVIGGIGWLCWKYLGLLALGGGRAKPPRAVAARVVMGLEVAPESLPPDIPGAVRSLWQKGRRQEALGLLYRGTISRVIEHGQVEIRQADTEGDCLRRVEQAGAVAHPGYFRRLTAVWIALAYAGIEPADAAVEALCREWPFVDGRVA